MPVRQGHTLEEGPATGCHKPPSVCDPSGKVVAVTVAALQLIHATVRHASSVVQHVLPGLRERAPQQADELLRRHSEDLQAQPPAMSVLTVTVLSHAVGLHRDRQGSAADSGLQQLLLSPHMLPYLVLVLMGHTASIRRALAADSHGVEDSSSSGSGSSNGSTGRPLRQQQFATVANGGSSSRAASALWLLLLQTVLVPCAES